MGLKKITTQIDAKVLKELEAYVAKSGRSIPDILSESIREYLTKVRRPGFGTASEEVLSSNEKLLKRLAK